MTTSHVLDASALALAFLQQDGARAFTGWLRERLDEADPLLAPRLLSYEIGSVITRELEEAGPEERRAVHEDATSLVRFADPPPGSAFEIAGDLTYYDGVYLSLARTEEARLVTGDTELAERAEDLDVPTLVF